MSLICRPFREDHFPATKRGHGSTHPQARFNKNGVKTREGNLCVDETCILHSPKSRTLHTDQNANIRDWCDERGLSVKTKERPRARYHTPVEALYAATGGWSQR